VSAGRALGWHQQADSVALIPEAKMGSAARRRQYEQPEYEQTTVRQYEPKKPGLSAHRYP
jgi:hypothetical protein